MILFIDTHDSLITIGLKIKDKIYVKVKDSEFSHSIFTMPMIKELMDENNAKPEDLTKIIVVNGPGSFTGIRIGLSIAKTLAYSLGIEIVTVSSLTAYLVSSESVMDKMCIIKDNKGCYVSVFDKDNNVVVEECYAENDNFDYPLISNKISLTKVFNYCEKLPCIDVHQVKANYVKKIEVEK